MEYKDVIKTIEVAKAEVEWNYPLDYQEAFDIGVECIEKQIPKKPKEDGIYRMCPVCDCYVGYEDAMSSSKAKYCAECGQRID